MLTGNVRLMNVYPFEDIEAICRRPVLFIAGKSAPTPESSAKRPTGSR
jgi:hypothetical protein